MAFDRYVVIGNPIEHSKSPQIHARFAAQTGQDMVYERLLAPLDGFAACVREFIHGGGRGANVTVPFKLEAHALATTLSERARAAGAVNTLTFERGEIQGDNTDGIGLVRDIVHHAGFAVAGKRILLLGAGGAARGVLLSLLEQGPARLVIANRTVARAQALARQFAAHGNLEASAFEDLRDRFDLVVNATSAGLSEQMPPIPAAVFDPRGLAYEMVYGAQPTAFMRFAAQHGTATRDGLGMLVEQAAEAFYIWRGVRPGTAAVYAELRAQI